MEFLTIMKLIRRTSFKTFATIESPIKAQYVKVIDTKTHSKVIVKNPEYIPNYNQQDEKQRQYCYKPYRTLKNY